MRIRIHNTSVADPDPGSGAFLTPGSGIRNRFFPDPGSRILNPYFWEFSDNFLGKKFYNSMKIGPNFFLQQFETKIMWNLWLHRKVWHQIFFHPSFVAVFGSGIRDPGWVKIRIRDKHPGSATLHNTGPCKNWTRNQCSGSASVWAFQILLTTSKTTKKITDFYSFLA